MQPFLCWFLLGICPEVVLNFYNTPGLVLHRLPISGRTSGFSSRAPDMFPNEFPQFRISCPDFPTLFPEVHWALSLELPYLRSSTELRWMSSGLHSEIRGTYSGKGHSARAEAKPFLLYPTLRMVSNTPRTTVKKASTTTSSQRVAPSPSYCPLTFSIRSVSHLLAIPYRTQSQPYTTCVYLF